MKSKYILQTLLSILSPVKFILLEEATFTFNSEDDNLTDVYQLMEVIKW